MKVLAVFYLLLVATLANYDIESILRDLPREELNSFLRYHITVGHDVLDNKLHSFDTVEHDLVENRLNSFYSYPEEFSIALYKYALERAKINDEIVLDKLREIVCFDDGVCIDMGDIGAHPISQITSAKLNNRLIVTERFKLLRHHIRIGHDLSTNKMEESADNYSIKLYQYALAQAQITDEKYVAELMEIICFDDGVCIDVGDIGVHP